MHTSHNFRAMQSRASRNLPFKSATQDWLGFHQSWFSSLNFHVCCLRSLTACLPMKAQLWQLWSRCWSLNMHSEHIKNNRQHALSGSRIRWGPPSLQMRSFFPFKMCWKRCGCAKWAVQTWALEHEHLVGTALDTLDRSLLLSAPCFTGYGLHRKDKTWQEFLEMMG